MMDKDKRQARANAEDAIFNRMLIWLAGAIVVELLVILLRHVYVNMALGSEVSLALLNVFQVYRFLGLALTVLAAIWLIVSVKGGKKALVPGIVTAVLAVLWVAATLSYQLFDKGLSILMALPAVAAVLILIWFLYQRTFFVSAVITACGLAALWAYREFYPTSPTAMVVIFVIGWALLIAAAVLAKKLSGSHGKLGKVKVMPEGTVYPVIYLTCLVTAVVMALAMVLGLTSLGTTAAFYLLFVQLAWLFGQAVYFTVKLM